MKEMHFVKCKKNVCLQSMKEKRVLVCIAMIEMYCDNENVLL